MPFRKVIPLLLIFQLLLLTACGNTTSQVGENKTFYEVFVYSFSDSNEDGIGDLKGLTNSLDYLNDGNAKTDDDLGITGIWLMPIMPSNSYHKYDVNDYCSIDKDYGTIEDFKELIKTCDEREVDVIIDMVINHTSSSHPWFLEACEYLRNLGDEEVDLEACQYVAYYHFSKEKINETYHLVEGSNYYYEGAFYEGMPDLDLENDLVREEFKKIVSFWFDLGVSGFRLDAVKEFVSGNSEKNIEILSWFNDMTKSVKEDAYLVGEAWSNQSDYAPYYKSGVDSFFDFHFANSDGVIANTIKTCSGYTASSYAKAVVKEQELYQSYNENYINAPFYTNHDLGRSAGYYSGEHSTEQTKMALTLNLTMTGNAFLYYGEELGMKGSGKDENKRLGFMWSESNQCVGPIDADDVKQKYLSLEEQKKDEASIYNYCKKLIHLRNNYPQISDGFNEFMEELSTDAICALRKTCIVDSGNGEEIILLMNISEEMKEVDLSNVSINGKTCNKKSIKETLYAGNEEMSFNEKDGVLQVPGYALVILK